MPDLNPKPLPPDLSFKALFYANTSYDYFADAASQPFQFTADRFESVNAWWLAEVSLLSYVQQHDFVSRKLADAGLPNCEFFENETTGTQAFIAHNSDFIIVCFRGTEMDRRDILTDLKIRLVQSAYGGKVHQGFKEALDSVWEEMYDYLDIITDFGSSKIKVWFTGHSLGGALATLAATRYARPQGIYTTASPRCGDKQFCKMIPKNYWRFVNNNDVICMLPPAIGCRHGGMVAYIDDQGQLHQRPGFWRRFTTQLTGHFRHMGTIYSCWKRGDFAAVPLDNIADHAPIYYVVHIWNNHIRQSQ